MPIENRVFKTYDEQCLHMNISKKLRSYKIIKPNNDMDDYIDSILTKITEDFEKMSLDDDEIKYFWQEFNKA